MIRLRILVSLLLIVASAITAPRATWAVPLQAVRLPDGVILWTPKEKPGNKPRFFSMVEDLAKILLPDRAELPFDRSIAFLVGVSDYKNLKPLPFVKNDLQDMKDYLLQNGFDQVYVAAEEIVSSDLIESYMMNRFPDELGKRDRLLFYYAGHGADARGRTGYLQFAHARPGDFARSVLAVERVLEWGRVNGAAHMLFLLDTCSSGLAFNPRGSWDESEVRLIQTLSGQGSRSVVTAGTANEESFEVRSASGKGNGVFTRAFLSALEQGKSQGDAPPFLTIEQVVADLQISVSKFAAERRKPLHPNLWTFDDTEYRGSFLFLNPAVRNSSIKESHLSQMRASPRGPSTIPAGGAEKITAAKLTGTVTAAGSGTVTTLAKSWAISSARLRKKPFLLFFWATWCVPCTRDLPELAKLDQRFGDNVMFVGVALDSPSIRERVQEISAKNGLNSRFVQYLAEEGSMARLVFRSDKDVPLPSFAIFDARGELLGSFSGSITETGNMERLTSLLKRAADDKGE